MASFQIALDSCGDHTFIHLNWSMLLVLKAHVCQKGCFLFCSHRRILLFLSPCFLWCTTGLCFGSYSVFITPAADFQGVCWWNPNLFPGYFDVSVEVSTQYQRQVLKKMIVVPLWMISLMPLCLVFLIVLWWLEVSECFQSVLFVF